MRHEVHQAEPSDLTFIAKYMDEEDAQECRDFGYQPSTALLNALEADGPTKIVWDNYACSPIGAFGICAGEPNRIWSLWTHGLTLSNSAFVMLETRRQVPLMLREIGAEEACNEVSRSNRRAIRWINASGCFTLGMNCEINGRPYFEFKTKPLEELDKLCADH